jgi:hypothetical protein
MSDGPQLEVLDAVVPPVSIAVMNNLVWQERATQMESHHKSMFSYR